MNTNLVAAYIEIIGVSYQGVFWRINVPKTVEEDFKRHFPKHLLEGQISRRPPVDSSLLGVERVCHSNEGVLLIFSFILVMSVLEISISVLCRVI
jgi:hypothetical protein